MSVDRKEIDLIIRAAVQGGKTLDGVTKSIADIEKALTAQADAAKRGESSIEELKSTLLALQKVQDQLKDQAGLIGQFDKLGKQLANTAEKSVKASKAHDEYRLKLEAAGKATEFQANKLLKLAAASERQGGLLAKQRADYESLGGTLREAGIDIDKLSDAENKARQSAAQLGLTIAKTNDAISTYAADIRKARDEAKKLADDTAFTKKIEEAARLNKAGEYIRFWSDALNAADVAEQQLQANQALRKAADDAVAAARGYKTLGTAIKSLDSSSGGLRGMVDGIVNPSEQARSTLKGVEEQIAAVSTAAKSAKGPIENYRSLMNDLTAATKSIGEKASLVDSFTKQTTALRASRSEFSQARAQVLQYAEAVRNSSGQNDALQASLRQAQVRLAAAQKTLADQLAVTRGLRDAMREAGLSTNDLAGAQSRLTSAARNSVSALSDLTAAKERYGTAVREASNAQGMFENSGRTTLSWLQRIRGEVLSLIAAYAGIYGAIEGANRSIDAFNQKQALRNQLAVAVGNDPAAIDAEYGYARGQADRIGTDFQKSSEQLAKFAVAAKLAGREANETKYIIESFGEAGTVLNLSGEKMERIFVALEQMMSQGKVQAEELSGQLKDSLPGAFGIFQTALKDKFPDLKKAMKDGQVGVENLIVVAEHLRNMFADRLPVAMQSLQANQNRLNSSIFDFKVMVAEKGFADEYSKLIKTLTEYLKSSDGEQFAKTLSDAFSAVANALTWIVKNAELVKETLYVGLGLLGARAVATLAIALASLPTALRAVATQGAIASTAVGNIGNAFKVLTVGLIGWEIGTILREKFAVVRQFGVSLVVAFEATWTTIKYGAQIVWEEIPAFFMDGLAKLGNLLTSGVRSILGIFSAAAKALGNDALGESIDAAISAIEFKVDRIGNASATLRKQLVADLKQIRKIGQEMFDEAARDPSTAPNSPTAPATPKPGKTAPGKTVVDDGATEKRIKIKEQLENELTAIEARIEKNEKDNLSRRIEAIDLSYQKLIKKIRAFGGTDGAEMEVRLTKDVNELKMQEIRKFNDTLEKEHEQITRKLETVDAAAGRREKTDLQARLDAVKLQYEQTYRDIADYRDKLLTNGRDTAPADEAKRRLDGGVQSLQNLETQKYYEDSINSLLDQRKAKLDTINAQRQAGLMTEGEANRQATVVVDEMQPKIQTLADEGLRYAEAMITAAEALGQNTTGLETLRAKMIAAADSGKGLTAEAQLTQKLMDSMVSGGTTAFTTMGEAITKSALGFQSWKDGIAQAKNAFLGFAADFLKQIAMMIIKQMILNALQSAAGGGGIFGGIAGMIVGKKHSGGVIGAAGGMTMRAHPAWFTNAPRYHGGGIAGLAPDEYPTVLKKNEEVLTTSDPRNVLNGGTTGGQAPQTNLKIMNMIDSGSMVSEGLATQDGEKAFMNFVRANRRALKQVIG